MQTIAPWIAPCAAAAAGYVGARTLWYAMQNPGCSWLVPSVQRGSSARRSVALTFDDGPSESTPRLLALLERNGVPATFFQCGANARRLPAIARSVAAASHEIGNHTDSHQRLCFKSRDFIRRELAAAQSAIADATGVSPTLFRPPFGLRWFGLAGVQHELGLRSVLWSTIGGDWQWPAAQVVDRVMTGLDNGAIICLHDGRRLGVDPDISATLDAVGRLIPMLRDRGFAFETVGQIVRD
jgi:peptidoglycan/xylan/chitin deacetylase (PgdA/CDA1 family)